MASLGTVSWGSSPVISIVFTYDYYRSGANMVYNVHVSVQPVTGARYFGYPIYVEVKMDGSAHGSGTIKSASPSQWSSAINWSTGNQTISNKTSGSTSLSIRVYSGSGSSRDTTYSYSMAVSPAGSTLTASNGTLGTAQTITINKQNASFTDTVTYTCGAASGTIVTDTLSGSVSWTPPISLASQVTDSTSVPVTLTTTTKSGGTTIQSNSITITCAIPASVKPSASVAISDPTGYVTTYGAYVQSKSTLQSVITATTSYGSPINTYSTVADGNTYTTQTTTTPVLQNTGAQTVTATVTDKRGRTSDPATASYTVLAYAQPTLTSCVIQRCNSGGTADPEGHYMSISFTGAITPLNNRNSATWSIRYRVAGSGTWTNVALSSLTGNYTPTHQEIIAAADANAFEVEVRASDDFGTITVGTGSIPVAFTIMNWRTQGDGMAIGGINNKAGLQVYMPTEHYDDVSVDGDIFNYGANATDTLLECKNLLQNTASTTTVNGVTFTVNSDGSVLVNGTASALTFFGWQFSIKKGDYVLNGAPTGGQLTIRDGVGGSYSQYFSGQVDDYGSGASFSVSQDTTAYMNIRVASGTTLSNAVFKPMIRDASITNADYVPYAMTNRQLTENSIIEQGTSGDWTYRKWSSGFAECWGKIAKTATNYQTVNGFYAYNLLVTFPTGLFNAAPFVIFSAHAQSSAHTIADTQLNGTSSQINLYVLLNVSGSQTIDLYVHAFGRWQ